MRPEINPVVPSAVAFVQDDQGRVLVTDNVEWARPGGYYEPGEFVADTVIPVVKEETGYDVEVGTYTKHHHQMEYDDGKVRVATAVSAAAGAIRLVGAKHLQTSARRGSAPRITATASRPCRLSIAPRRNWLRRLGPGGAWPRR